MHTYTGFLIVLLFSVSSLFLTGCLSESTSGSENGTNAVGTPTDPSDDLSKIERAVCDPFQTNSVQNRERGLVGNLLYLMPDQPSYNRVDDYLNYAQVANVQIYLDRLFVPTRPSDRPFYMQNGNPVLSLNGEAVYKNFALRMHSQLQLAANENPGYYQLAVLSNDGAVLRVPDGQGGFKTIVDNDGKHPSQFACASEPIYLDGSSKLPIILDYFQGDSGHLSLVTMWRPWPNDPNAIDGHDSYCGRQGNGLFFKFSENPVDPQKHFYEMLEQNWKVLENENYYFPEQTSNPCAPQEDKLMITSYSISGVGRDRVTLTWTTNIPSTSQGEIKIVSNGSTYTTSVDAGLVQYHSLTITGLSPNTLYSVKAISSTPGGQSVSSDERAFRTPR